MASVTQMTASLRQLWARLSRTQQMALIGIAGGALVFAFIFFKLGGAQPAYVTAFTNLDPKDSAAVVEQLKADGIPSEVTPDGSTVKVPSNRLADARLRLAAKGLPQGGSVGFELFDKTSFGVTDFVQHLNYQRALEGELSRTINTLDQVESSRVHIVVPKQELFTSQQKPATASVVLHLRPGRTLDEGSLRGLSHMVARSVEGLEQKNITIVDAGTGRMLFDGGSADTGAGLTATQLDVQKKVEQDIQAQVQAMLDRVAGSQRNVVSVKADMDFSQQETLAETYTPGGANNQGVPRSSSTVQESFNGTGQAGAQPGAAANVPPTRAGVAGAGTNSQYERSETTTNFEVSKNTQKTVRGPGEIKRLSVSVMLDSSISPDDAAGLRDAIGAAAGLNQERGDQLVIATAAFSGNGLETLQPATPALADAIARYAKIGVPVAVALLVLFIVWRMSRSVAPRRATAFTLPPPALPAGTPGFAYDLAGPEDVTVSIQRPAPPVEALPPPETPEQVRRRQQIQDRMTALVSSNPDAAAEIIQTWIRQDERKK
jgi:flagellar M-ring protein FliF